MDAQARNTVFIEAFNRLNKEELLNLKWHMENGTKLCHTGFHKGNESFCPATLCQTTVPADYFLDYPVPDNCMKAYFKLRDENQIFSSTLYDVALMLADSVEVWNAVSEVLKQRGL
jgi:hypothetical protein